MRFNIASAHLSRTLLAACIVATMAACGSPAVTPPGEDAAVPQPDGGCTSSAECSDDVFCNGVERCMDGVCLPSSAPACAGTDRCDEAADTCGGACVDSDGDGACAEDDCDDANPNRFPGALERCDTADQDCNPATLGPDGDGDGSSAIDCCNPQSSGTPLCGNDCDDTRATVNTSALESCNGRDDDCDALVDEDVLLTFYRDMDGDNFGDSGMTMQGCSAPTGWALAGGDCNDEDARFKPSGTDSCDLLGDDNCNGPADEGCDCTLGDTQECGPIAQHMIGICLKGTQRCIGGRWESSCPGSVPPAAESCNSLDDDCDGVSDDGVCVACPTGYAGVDGMCTDINECDTSACGATSTGCTNMPGTYACTCAPGYAAPATGGTCMNVNECAGPTNPCGVGTCTDLTGSYRCSACPVNYVEVTTPVPACAWDSPALSDLGTSNGVLGPFFSATTTAYTLRLALRVETLTLTPLVPVGFVGTITVQGLAVMPGSASAAISLPLGGLDIAIVVRAASGRERTYTVRAARGFEAGGGTYVKASNTGANDTFGYAVALSADGSTLAVGAYQEDSSATGVGGSQADNSASSAGAVYVFRRAGGSWAQEAYIKASNTTAFDEFGYDVALSGDGSTLAVGARGEDSSATGVGGNQADNSAVSSGAVYVFRRTGSTWAQEAYVKASTSGASDEFGYAIALSSDGSTLAVGAYQEDSSATGIGGNQADNSALDAGAVYVFRRTASVWAQEAYLKASNTGAGDTFGYAVALSSDGFTLAVGARYEDSMATGVGGDQADNSASGSGAGYVFRRAGGVWSQEAYVKASNPGVDDRFGFAVALSGDGAALVVGALLEGSSATGVGGDQANNAAPQSGAVYSFRRTSSTWAQDAYIKASNTQSGDTFGYALALSSDGSKLAVGAIREDSSASGVGGNQADDFALSSGAVYAFHRAGSGWAQEAYVKASNTNAGDSFGSDVALSGDGSTLAVGAPAEASSATGVGGNQTDNSASAAGAVYVNEPFRGPSAERYLKASNTGTSDEFGSAIALAADGSTLAIGAYRESSNAVGIGGDGANNSTGGAGAVYVFRRTGSTWAQEAYIKASNTGSPDRFGIAVALSADGSSLAVGAGGEDSNATGIGGNQADDSSFSAGATYVFRRTGSTWAQEAYIKASNTGADDLFGDAVALSGDGATLVVSARQEDSSATGVGGNQADNSALQAGAVYVFRRTGGIWAQEAYLKASNTGAGDYFGAVALSSDGSTLAVGAYYEDSSASGLGGDQADNSALQAGAVYVFRRTGGVWAQEAYVKASNPGVGDFFGSVALSSDGATLAVGASSEDSSATGVGGNQADNSAPDAGAVYVFRRTGGIWSQESYVKASNTGAGDLFRSVALSADGSTLAVGAAEEDSTALDVGGSQTDNSAGQSGAVYVFRRTAALWVQEAYVKASNTGAGDSFGSAVALSADGSSLAVGAPGEASTATGVGGNQADNSAMSAGAVYTYRW